MTESRAFTGAGRPRLSGAPSARAFLPCVAGIAVLPCFHGRDCFPGGLSDRLRSCAKSCDRDYPLLFAGRRHCRRSCRYCRFAHHSAHDLPSGCRQHEAFHRDAGRRHYRQLARDLRCVRRLAGRSDWCREHRDESDR